MVEKDREESIDCTAIIKMDVRNDWEIINCIPVAVLCQCILM